MSLNRSSTPKIVHEWWAIDRFINGKWEQYGPDCTKSEALYEYRNYVDDGKKIRLVHGVSTLEVVQQKGGK